jgi:hypothetical protein
MFVAHVFVSVFTALCVLKIMHGESLVVSVLLPLLMYSWRIIFLVMCPVCDNRLIQCFLCPVLDCYTFGSLLPTNKDYKNLCLKIELNLAGVAGFQDYYFYLN